MTLMPSNSTPREFGSLPMRVLLRADSGVVQGTGHVMRCLTLAEALMARGHAVELMTGEMEIEWLAELLRASGLAIHSCNSDEIPIPTILQMQPDWVVVDSYQIAPEAISTLNEFIPVLAVIDGDDRKIEATLYLDHNLGAETAVGSNRLGKRMMPGAGYALIRNAVLAKRRKDPWRPRSDPPAVLSFMGGTDPTGTSLRVAEALAKVGEEFDLTIIAPTGQHDSLRALLKKRPYVQLVAPTPALPDLLGQADIVVAAAGTSAWDVCALGLPAVLVAVVDNQRASLHEATSRGLTLGIDGIEGTDDVRDQLGELAIKLLSDASTRHDLSTECLKTFDGCGKVRVVERMEAHRAQMGGGTR